jgi:hypothetical protein
MSGCKINVNLKKGSGFVKCDTGATGDLSNKLAEMIAAREKQDADLKGVVVSEAEQKKIDKENAMLAANEGAASANRIEYK